MRLLCLLIWLPITISFSGLCHADFVFLADANPTESGVQSVHQLTVGDSFGLDIYLQITGTSQASGYAASVQFDNSKLFLESVSVPVRPEGFGQFSTFDLAAANNTGILSRFDNLNLSDNLLVGGYEGIIGTLNFRALAPGYDVPVLPFFVAGFDGIIDENFDAVPSGNVVGDGGVFFQGAFSNITAVPEPTSLFLCGSGLAGWFTVYCRRRNKSSKKSGANSV